MHEYVTSFREANYAHLISPSFDKGKFFEQSREVSERETEYVN